MHVNSLTRSLSSNRDSFKGLKEKFAIATFFPPYGRRATVKGFAVEDFALLLIEDFDGATPKEPHEFL
jgi:hypothetical protein